MIDLDPVASVVMLVVGLAMLGFSASVIWGVIGSGSAFVTAARARYAYGMVFSLWFGQRRVLAITPFFGLTAAAYGAAGLASVAGIDAAAVVLSAIGTIAGFLVFVALARPGPFLPTWFRDVDARQRAGLPPTVPPPPEGVRLRPASRRSLAALYLVLGGLVVAGVVLAWPAPVLSALLIGIAFATGAQWHATRS